MSAKQTSQQNFFQENSNPNNGISLCVPRVFPNIKWHDVKKAIIETGMGFVERVDLIPVWKDGKVVCKRAYIHFKAGKWNMRNHRETLVHLQNGNTLEIMYDEPWFWKASISKVKRPVEGPKAKDPKVKVSMVPRVKRKERLDLSERKPSADDLDEGEIAEDNSGVVGEDPIASRQAEVAYGDGYVPDGTGGFIAKEWATDEQLANRVENWKELSSM
jgi:hypothetical protein